MDASRGTGDEAWWAELLARRLRSPAGAAPDGPWAAVASFAFADVSSRSFVLAHLGQSVDGRIATRSGHSHYVTGRGNIVHLHRLRALADAVVVGAGTVAADDPRLTVRHVDGPSPVRVVVDPDDRLGPDRAVFAAGGPETLHLVARQAGRERTGAAFRIACDGTPSAIVAVLAERGHRRIFVEGGGTTVSRFVAARRVDRLQICVAPLIIGSGIMALTLPEIDRLDAAMRPPVRIHAMGDDVLFDFDLSALQQ